MQAKSCQEADYTPVSMEKRKCSRYTSPSRSTIRSSILENPSTGSITEARSAKKAWVSLLERPSKKRAAPSSLVTYNKSDSALTISLGRRPVLSNPPTN